MKIAVTGTGYVGLSIATLLSKKSIVLTCVGSFFLQSQKKIKIKISPLWLGT